MSKPNFYSSESYSRANSLGWMFKYLKQSIVRQAGLQLHKEGLTHAQWEPLVTLYFCGTCPVATLVRELDADAGALTRLLDRLEAKGLVRRERSTEDRRVVMVSLSETGQALTAKLPSVLSDVFNAHLDGFSHAEWQLLLSLLQRMIDNGEALRQAAQAEDEPSSQAKSK